MALPKIINRTIYLGYYIKKTERKKFWQFVDHVSKITGRSKLSVVQDAVVSTYRYNVSLMDYFYFRFFDKSDEERQVYAGTGFMYEYQRHMNPLSHREVLFNKFRFFESYGEFVKHKYCTLEDVEQDNDVYRAVKAASSDKLVLKDALGQCGWGVEVIDASMERARLLKHMRKRGFNLVEQYVEQHPALAGLSSSGLNTIRVITQLDDDSRVNILGALLRISINSFVDNIAMGNIAAPIEVETGKIKSAGVYSDIIKGDEEVHPVTGKTIKGFQIPYWQETIELTTKAALHHPENRSIGWDVAITEAGPSLIEGNHNWCKLLWQLPHKKGMKRHLQQYYNPEKA